MSQTFGAVNRVGEGVQQVTQVSTMGLPKEKACGSALDELAALAI